LSRKENKVKRGITAVVVLALAAFVAVTVAWAAPPTQGRLVVASPVTNVGAASSIHLTSILAPNTYRTTVYVPAGYRAPGGVGTVGQNVGKAHVFVRDGDGSRITLNGALSVANPSQYPKTGCATVAGPHRAVWVLKATQTRGTATVTFPIFVDRQAPSLKLPASVAYRLQYCTGGLGLDIAEVDLGLVRMFVNPAARGMYMWRTVYEPSSDGSSIDSGRSTLVASAVPIGAQVSLKSTRVRSRPGWVTLSGAVLVARKPLGGVKVHVYVGRSQRLALRVPKATVRTKADGTYRISLRLGTGTWYARAKATSPYLDITPGGGCTTADRDHLSRKGCVDATLSPVTVQSKPLTRITR
jgi:hypothetical protein